MDPLFDLDAPSTVPRFLQSDDLDNVISLLPRVFAPIIGF